MTSRDKAECAYCGAAMRRDNLTRHTRVKHAGLPVREKGWKDITSMLPSSTKRPRLDSPEDEDLVKENVNESEAVEVIDVEDSNSELSSASAPSTSSSGIRTPSAPTNPCCQSSDSSQEESQNRVLGEGDKECRKGPALSGKEDDITTNQPTMHAPLLDRTLPFPSDPANFIDRVMTTELCEVILSEGPCQPGLNKPYEFKKNENGRRFLQQWYKPTLKNGMQSYRDWLVYSPTKDRAYCFPCWLFADKTNQDYEPNFSDPKLGYKRWRDATTSFASHETCKVHKNAVQAMIETKQRLKLGKSVNAEQQRARDRQVAENRKVLCRLIDATLFLAKQNLAFRGSHECTDHVRGTCTRHSCLGKAHNEGNFLELIKLLANYDGALARHLTKAPKNASYLSPTIQNEFINSIAQVITDKIVAEVKKAHYFGIIMDSTIDISHIDQLSFCVRYIDEMFIIQERFLLFTDITASDSESLFITLNKILTTLGLDLKLIRSQSYDGAANMSGKISGLQTRVKQENDLALYVHCCAHNLNLVLSDACHECTEAVTFFGTIQKLYNFFTSSQPRHNVLESALKELEIPVKRLQKQCETRWYCNDAVKSIKETYSGLLLALEKLSVRGMLKQRQRAKAC